MNLSGLITNRAPIAMNSIARRSRLSSQRKAARNCLSMIASRDPFSEYQSPAVGGSANGMGKARERPGQEFNGDELAEAFRRDLHAKMMTSPMRRCAVTGAKLPRDFLICLRPAVYPTSGSSSSDTPDDPREGNIYLVPDKILHPNHNDKLGKGSWLLCHRGLVQTFIDRPGSSKRISSLASVSKLLPLQIENQLQTKLVNDFLLFSTTTAFSSSLTDLNLTDLDRLKAGEEVLPGILAVLDIRGMTAESIDPPRPRDLLSKEEDETKFPPVPLYSIYGKDTPRSGLPDREIPVYELDKVLPKWMHKSILDALSEAGSSPTGGYLAVTSTPELFPRGDNAALEVCKSLWRLRLYQGQGWAGMEREVEPGLVVKGFEELMEGKMHGRIS